MFRDLEALTARGFDLLIVGGGIHGLMAAWDASLRGLRVALIEREDFGAGASFHYHRRLHGGLRWLDLGDLPGVRQATREQRAWMRIAPQLISTQLFAAAVDGRHGASASLLRAAFAAEALLSLGRRGDAPPQLQLSPGRLQAAGAPHPSTDGLLPDGRLAFWHEYRAEHAERLTLSVALAASRAGAVLANYVEAVDPLREQRKVSGMAARDRIDGQRLTIRAQVTLNAAGASAGRLMASFGVRGGEPHLLKAMNVVTRRPAPVVACGGAHGDRQVLFAMPWHGRLSIGTWYGSDTCSADAGLVTPDEFRALLDAANEAFPALGLQAGDVLMVQRGLLPAVVKRGRVRPADRPILREHRRDGVDGAISLFGGHYTTARALAEQAVTLATAQLGRHAPPRSAILPLIAPAPADLRCPDPAIDAEAWQHLLTVYGADATRVAATAAEDPALAERVVPDSPVIGAQIVEAARNEMTYALEDVVLRRTGIGSAGYPGDEAIVKVERILKAELGWTTSRAEAEVQLLKEYYLPVHV